MSVELWYKTEHLVPWLLVMAESWLDRWVPRESALPTVWELVAFHSFILCAP